MKRNGTNQQADMLRKRSESVRTLMTILNILIAVGVVIILYIFIEHHGPLEAMFIFTAMGAVAIYFNYVILSSKVENMKTQAEILDTLTDIMMSEEKTDCKTDEEKDEKKPCIKDVTVG